MGQEELGRVLEKGLRGGAEEGRYETRCVVGDILDIEKERGRCILSPGGGDAVVGDGDGHGVGMGQLEWLVVCSVW